MKIKILGFILLTSCATFPYYQLHEIKSSNVNIETMEFENNALKINYNFWSEYGNSKFLITNKTDSLIFLNMEYSHFIYNGIAFPYYTNVILTSSTSNSNTRTKYNPYFNLYQGYNYRTTASTTSYSKTISDNKIIIIPPKSSKYIDGFNIGYLYKTCDFNNPTDSIKINFDLNNTPIKFSNLFYYSIGSETNKINEVSNNFYVSKISNYLSSDFYSDRNKVECGKVTYELYRFSKYQKTNRYFIGN